MKDAHEASIAMRDLNPEAEGKYLDQINDASSVIGWREKHNLPYPEQGKFEEDGLPGYDAWKTASPYDDEPSQEGQDKAYDYAVEYGEDYLTTDKMAIANIFDIKNPDTDPEDRDGYVSDLASDVIGTITRELENDGMLYLNDEEIRDMAAKLVSKHLSK